MPFMKEQLPRYLLGKTQLVWTVTFTALFALVSILLWIPFADNAWLELGISRSLMLTVSFLLISFAVIVTSKVLMYARRGAESFTFLRYIVWNLLEVVAISLLYTFFTRLGMARGMLDIGPQSLFKIFFGAFVFTLACVGVPYVIAALYLSLEEKSNTIRLMNYGAVVSDTPAKPYDEKRITLFDNNGILKFSIDSSNLYFIESDDNYIKVWYTDCSGEVRQYMLRCRLKTVEESFADSDLVRCHRKYIVNIANVKILKAEKEGYRISLDIDNVDTIPISKTYEQNVLARFNSK